MLYDEDASKVTLIELAKDQLAIFVCLFVIITQLLKSFFSVTSVGQWRVIFFTLWDVYCDKAFFVKCSLLKEDVIIILEQLSITTLSLIFRHHTSSFQGPCVEM